MRLFNKFVESKNEPSNKNDIWFDGSVFKIYKEEGWRTITLTKEAIDRIVEYSKSLDIYVMVDALPESGEKGKIYVLQTIEDDSVKLEEYIWKNNGWKLVDNFNSVSLVLDNELSETSHNAVANHVITEELKRLNEVIEDKGSYNIGSIELFDQIIKNSLHHELTIEDKEAILGGKIITTSAWNCVIPAFGNISVGKDATILIFHYNENLYEMYVSLEGSSCYISGFLSKKQKTNWQSDKQLSMISENPVQNKVVTEALGNKQEQLVSGENIKTINGQSILGDGDIETNIDAPEIYGDTYFNTEVSGTSVYLSANVAETLDEVTERGKLIDAYDIKSELTELSAEVNRQTISLTNEKKAVDTTYVDGYINYKGIATDSKYAKISDFVELQEDCIYLLQTIPSSSWFIGYYAEANESSFISAQSLGATGSTSVDIYLDIPQSAKYVRVSQSKSYASYFWQISKSSLVNVRELAEKFGEEYYVKKDGSGDFTGIHQALAALAENENPKRIYIDGGEYDVFEEMGGQTFLDTIPTDVDKSLWYQYSNYVPHNTELIGMGEVIINFFPPTDTPTKKMMVINPMAFRGSVKLQNITINCARCRYGIHDESGTDSKYQYAVKEYHNVKVIHQGGGGAAAYGAGHGRYNRVVFENCYFQSKEFAWSIHDNSSTNNATIVLRSCAFSTPSSTSLSFGTLNARNGRSDVFISNCVIPSAIKLDDSASVLNKYALTIVESGNPNIVSDSGVFNYEPIIVKKAVASNENVLFGKSVSFDGDSICQGADRQGGYGKIIADRNGMVYENLGISGGTITAGTVVSSSGLPRHWICRDIQNINADADYVILEGGVNDSALNVAIGEVSNGYDAELDDTTFCGAFESMIKQCYERFPSAKLGYVMVHKMTSKFMPGSSYYDKAIEVLKKWGVPYIDLALLAPPIGFIPSLKEAYTNNADGWHPTALGYETFYCDKIEAWMKTL